MKKLNKFESFFDFTWFWYDFAKVTGIIPAIFLFRLKKIYLNKETKKEIKKGPVMIAANHHTVYDPLYLLTAFWNKRLGIIAADEVFKGFVQRTVFTMFHAIPINRQNVSINTFRQIKETVNRGHSIATFPEGFVDLKKDSINDYKSGIILMSIQNDLDIYPVFIAKRKNFFHRIKVYIGNKFSIKDELAGKKASKEDMELLANKLKEKELELQEYANKLES